MYMCVCVCVLTGLECSTVKKSGLVRNLALGDWRSRDRRDLELEGTTTPSLRYSGTQTHIHTINTAFQFRASTYSKAV